jgi:4-amino-4-deoxy-L-arabinose transferase-like glycosyltransferase
MSNRDSLLIFLIGVVVFTVGLSPEIIGFDCRFAMFAQEMLRNGPTFFPTTYGQPYPDYPGLSTFMIYLVSMLFGKVTPFTAVLPTAVASALILVVIYRIGAMRSRQWGLFAVLIALFTHEFLIRSRSLTPDQYVSLATTLSFYLAYSANFYGRKKRLWFIPLVLVASFAFRGPIGIVIPAAVVCAYYLFNRDFKLFALMAFTSSIIFLLCFKWLLVAAAYQGGVVFADRVWKMQMAGRIDEGARHWIGYYWTGSFVKYAVAYPIAVIVAISLYKKILRRENADYKFFGYLILWMFVILLGMSIPSTKKMRYIVPMVPPAALLASYIFIGQRPKGLLSGLKEIFLGFCRWFPAGTGILALVVWVFGSQITAFAMWAHGKQLPSLFAGYYLVTIFLMAVLTAVVWHVNARFKEGPWRDLGLMIIGAVTFNIIIVCIGEPVEYDLNKSRPFVEKVETLQRQNQGDLVFYKISADGAAIKFMINLDKPVEPQFIRSPEAILNCKEPAYFISKEKDFADLPKDVAQHIRHLASGKIGRDDCVIFTNVEMFVYSLENSKSLSEDY